MLKEAELWTRFPHTRCHRVAKEMYAKEMVLICRVSVMQPQLCLTRFSFFSVPAAFRNCLISLLKKHSSSRICNYWVHQNVFLSFFLSFFLCLDLCPPTYCRCRGYYCSWSHNDTHKDFGRTPLDEGSARRRDLHLAAHYSHNRQTPCPRRYSNAHFQQ